MDFGKEKIYTIPVNDAFAQEKECPVCSMYQKLEDDAVDFVMGTSYMEEDVRAKTDEMGFCREHMKILAVRENKLGLALILDTHLKKMAKDIEALSKNPVKSGGLFKKAEESPLKGYLKKQKESCYICDRVNGFMERYLDTIVFMWKTDAQFKKNYEGCKGFCTKHLGELLETADKKLKGKDLENFYESTIRLYLDNTKRVTEDLDWFINKFDYRYKDEPWKNAKDALPRAIIKANSILPPEE